MLEAQYDCPVPVQSVQDLQPTVGRGALHLRAVSKGRCADIESTDGGQVSETSLAQKLLMVRLDLLAFGYLYCLAARTCLSLSSASPSSVLCSVIVAVAA